MPQYSRYFTYVLTYFQIRESVCVKGSDGISAVIGGLAILIYQFKSQPVSQLSAIYVTVFLAEV